MATAKRSNGVQRWRAANAPDGRADTTLERTTLRWGPDGWYLITSNAKNPRQAIERTGPILGWRNAEQALLQQCNGAVAGGARTNAQRNAVNAVLHEGFAARLEDAARAWIRATDELRKSDEAVGLKRLTTWERNQRFGNTKTPEGRRLHQLYENVSAAAATIEHWTRS